MKKCAKASPLSLKGHSEYEEPLQQCVLAVSVSISVFLYFLLPTEGGGNPLSPMGGDETPFNAQEQNQCFGPVGHVIRIAPFRKCK